MQTFRERLAELPITEWHGVRIRIIVEHPNARESMTYEVVHDDRLMPLGPIHRPVPEDHYSVIEFGRRMENRDRTIRALAEQVSAAMIHAMQRLDNE